MPKKHTVRGITNFRSAKRRRIDNCDGHTLTNSSLYNAYHVLRYVQTNTRDACGFGIFGLDEIYARIKIYRNNLLTSGKNASISSMPKLYFAVFDLEKCFDNIKPSKCFDIVSELLSCKPWGEDTRLILRYTATQYISSLEKAVTKPIRVVTFEDDFVPLQVASKEIAKKYYNSLISDGRMI